MIDNNIKSNISQGEELEELIAQLTQNGMQIKIVGCPVRCTKFSSLS